MRLLDARIERDVGRLECDLIELNASDWRAGRIYRSAIRWEVEREQSHGARRERSMGGLFRIGPRGGWPESSQISPSWLSFLGCVVVHLGKPEVAAATALRAPGARAAGSRRFLRCRSAAEPSRCDLTRDPLLDLAPFSLSRSRGVVSALVVRRNVVVWVSAAYSQFQLGARVQPLHAGRGGVFCLGAFVVAAFRVGRILVWDSCARCS